MSADNAEPTPADIAALAACGPLFCANTQCRAVLLYKNIKTLQVQQNAGIEQTANDVRVKCPRCNAWTSVPKDGRDVVADSSGLHTLLLSAVVYSVASDLHVQKVKDQRDRKPRPMGPP